MVDNNQEVLTNAAGIPVPSNTVSKSVGKQGPLLLEDYTLLEKMAHFNRERIPERVVRAIGSGAYGTFTVTDDITRYTKAKLFSEVGKQISSLPFLLYPNFCKKSIDDLYLYNKLILVNIDSIVMSQ